MHFLRFRLLGVGSLIAIVGFISLSCSSPAALNPVRGKVVHKGQPLAGALVTFHSKEKVDVNTIPSIGFTKEDGTFSLTTGDKEGAPAGEYIITIICSETVPAKKGVISTGPPDTLDRLSGAYSDKDASKIVVTVKPGENQLEPFDLK